MSERYQERVYKSDIEQAYDDAYWKIEQLIYKSNCYNNYSKYNLVRDLKVMLFVIADIIAYSLHTRDVIKNDLFPNFDLNLFIVDSDRYRHTESRIEFYSKIADDSITLRGDCLPNDLPSSFTNNPCTRCAIAFCDILMNPLLIDDYVSAPFLLRGFDKVFVFASKTVMPIMDIISEYIANVIKICNATKAKNPTSPTIDEGNYNSKIALTLLFVLSAIVLVIILSRFL